MSVRKSFEGGDPVGEYCLVHSSPMHPTQLRLIEETLKHPKVLMMGAPEVINMNSLLIKSLGAKKVLDVGVFTGASSLAAALSLPEDGLVVACDVSEEFTDIARKFWKEAGVESKVQLVLAPATQTLSQLIEDGEEGTFDFSFIDADKVGYDSYYELSLKFLRRGGIIAIDNTLWHGKVLGIPGEGGSQEYQDESTKFLQNLNNKLAKDSRVQVVQLNIGDGYTLATKL